MIRSVQFFRSTLTLFFFLLLLGLSSAQAAPPKGIDWQPWTAENFSAAKRSNKPILLYLEAVWCHWCHVMDDNTFTDKAVQNYLRDNYIVVRVDHDARPDLAERYRDWGWPAIIVFDGEGREIVKRAGYIAKVPFLRLLKAIIADPSPERDRSTQVTTTRAASQLEPRIRKALEQRHISAFDDENGGLKGGGQRFVDEFHTEWAMRLSLQGDKAAGERAKLTLDGGLKLIDPVWGGAYQYSTFGNWDNAHFEKIARTQYRYLRLYANAYAQYGDARYLQAAEQVKDYLVGFWLDANGAFYTSQDADVIPGKKSKGYFALNDAKRRQQGIPRIDKNQYARENGNMVEGLLALYEVTGDAQLTTMAGRALAWVEANRKRADGGYSHGSNDSAGPYLSDTLAMGQAQLAAYKVGMGRHYLNQAMASAGFIVETFKHPTAGVLTSVPDGSPILPIRKLEENVAAARFLNLLSHYSGKAKYKQEAKHVFAFLAAPKVALGRVEESGVLLVDDELSRDPTHLNVVETKRSAGGTKLYTAVLKHPDTYERVEYYNRQQGPLLHDDVPFPNLPEAAAYVCSNNRCSLPALTQAELQLTIDRLVFGRGVKKLPALRRIQ